MSCTVLVLFAIPHYRQKVVDRQKVVLFYFESGLSIWPLHLAALAYVILHCWIYYVVKT